MRKAVADESGQSLVDYALIAGCVAAVGVTLIALITQGTIGAFFGRIADTLSG